MSRLLSLVAALMLAVPAAADDGGFPQIIGTWTGTHLVGFAKSNPIFDDGPYPSEMELEVTEINDNLITATRRWRRVGEPDWVVVETIGTFQLDDPTRFILSDGGHTTDLFSAGILFGSYVENTILISYAGPGTGLAFAARLVREPDAASGDSK